ncbi:cysteine proteinase [Laetiporus sulphureus 93-53]|uniref:Cysteine proteinase n=1 Tax=Laetiporus sulphureus 93-53 TaxID=1314785 RepID=A0A165B717_9APHY|nr:cysteine proteinase [Laetiporus sulphureus 93-53]KZT00393.1 cysteine proteinase [Laetiporus sulphureus 93-53]
MGTSKRKSARAPPQLRSRTTRSQGKALSDPAESSQLLNEQLRAMGLYAAPTLGDGNCLFRALSDQLYGTPSYHLKLRQDICAWIASHKQRYGPFVDDERGIDVHLECMRQPATYGGHLELSAFAHMTRRDVKVIQPGLVYVIEWAAGSDSNVLYTEANNSTSTSVTEASTSTINTPSGREKRRVARDRKRAECEKAPPLPPPTSEDGQPPGPIYVAYHDYEHFSSIRNLRGPHAGHPDVIETPVPDALRAVPSVSPARKKPPSKVKAKPDSKSAPRQPAKTHTAVVAKAEIEEPKTPSQIPLPMSRSPSPLIASRASPAPAHLSLEISRSYRSPKRTFDESSASSQAQSESSQGAAKRAKSCSRPTSRTSNRDISGLPESRSIDMQIDDVDVDLDTPDLSVSGSSTASESSLSSAPSRAPTPPPAPPERPLTRRQRKALGLPKPRTAFVASTHARRRASAGKIVIPGGRYKKPSSKPARQHDIDNGDTDESHAEWKRNGTGRVDVRGFRELKI